MLTSQGLTNDEGHPNDDVSSWVSKMLFRLSGYHHQWDLSNQIIHITLVSIFCIAWVPKSLTFLQVRNTVVSYQNECFSSKSELPCLPPSSLELWRRERAIRQLSFRWKTLILIGHYDSIPLYCSLAEKSLRMKKLITRASSPGRSLVLSYMLYENMDKILKKLF